MKNQLSDVLSGDSQVVIAPFPGVMQFPLLIRNLEIPANLTAWATNNLNLLNEELKKYGAILLRGFDVDTVEKFQEFIAVFKDEPLEYKQRSSPRYEVTKNVYHSTTYPADQIINMHSENSYALNWAMKIIFCCLQPASEKGETPIADNRLVLTHLSEKTKEKFAQFGVRYVRNLSPYLGLPWQEVFQTEKKEEAENECRQLGMDFQWEEDETLVLSWNNKAIYNHPVTGEPIWFNHAFFFNKYALDEDTLSAFDSDDELPFNTYYGDGSEISKEEINEIRLAYEKSTVSFPWEKGDVLFMDNMLMAHGRNSYKGERKIVVSMLQSNVS